MKRYRFMLFIVLFGCSGSSTSNQVAQDAMDVQQEFVSNDNLPMDIHQDTGLSKENLYLMSDNFAKQVSEELVTRNNQFALKLFRELNKTVGANKNLFISPLSISQALSMTYNGATGETKEAIAKTLEYQGMDLGKINESWLNLVSSLEHADELVILANANSIWMDDGFAPDVKEGFLNILKAYFKSDLFTIDFEADDAKDKINQWVEKHTNEKIKELIPAIPPEAVMYLINALYFKANWLYPFPKDKTQKDKFVKADGTTVEVDMMRFEGNVRSFKYYADNDFCIVRLPYGRDVLAFYGVVPWNSMQSNKTIEDFIEEITFEKLEQYISKLDFPKGEYDGLAVAMPRFKIGYKKILNEILQALGMGPAFIGGFDNIAPNIFVSMVIHQTFVEVNEEGTEAASATAVEFSKGISPNFIANKPFLFLIRDDRSKSLLFIGKLADPASD